MMPETEHVYPTLGVCEGGMHIPIVNGACRERIVRCKDCKHIDSYTAYERTWPDITEYEVRYCKLRHSDGFSPDWFCADGEPKQP